jgi:hypothetical protein
VTAHLRQRVHELTELVNHLDHWPDPWPHRLDLHTRTITTNLDSALANLGALAHTAPEPDHARAPDPDAQRHGGDRKPSAVEIAATRASGLQNVVTQLETHIATAIAHIRIGNTATTTQQHDRARHAWIELGHACTIVEKWQTMDREERQTLLCSGLDLPGFWEWGDPECGNIASANPSGQTDRNGLCIACDRKREVWRVTNWRARRQGKSA